jgi:hypothetical protein
VPEQFATTYSLQYFALNINDITDRGLVPEHHMLVPVDLVPVSCFMNINFGTYMIPQVDDFEDISTSILSGRKFPRYLLNITCDWLPLIRVFHT